MFPGPYAEIYRNEDGEVIGWSDERSYEPDPYAGPDEDYDPWEDEE